MKKYLLFLSIIAVVSACKSSQSTTAGTSAKGDFNDILNEDLSVYRPALTLEDTLTLDIENFSSSSVTPEGDIRDSLQHKLSLMKERRNGVVDGYSIQVYSGISRSKAQQAVGRLYNIQEFGSPTLDYEQPNYKVKVGEYTSKLAAYGAHKQLRKVFPTALIVSDKIYLKRADMETPTDSTQQNMEEERY
ncbi:SPOR domain-containing protein [Algivirga pacifica]|uniref:Type IV secretion system putative lipoprotein virB7 n=1 Tax=Algivirga pacifica TaxID=1162670 RepID=A0ABP9DGA1_9BACT